MTEQVSDIALLFSTDPLSYTKEGKELERLIEHYRKSWHLFRTTGTVKEAKPKSAKAEANLSLAGKLNLTGL
jgi:hypothetical protein